MATVARPAVTAAWACAPSAARRRAEHRVAHRLHAMLAQALGGFFVFLGQQFAQQVAHVLHPQLADLCGNAGLTHHLLQRADVALGPQRIAFRLHTAQTLGSAHQGVEFCQHGVRGMERRLLGLGQLHLGLHLAFVHERKLAKVHAGVVGRTASFSDCRAFGKDFEQGHGIALDQRSLVLVEQAQRIAEQIALLDVAASRLLAGQGTLGDLDELPHQCLAPANGVDNAGAENGSQTRGGQGHGGREESGKRFPDAILLDLGPYLRALKRIRLGFAPSSPSRFFLSASYSW